MEQFEAYLQSSGTKSDYIQQIKNREDRGLLCNIPNIDVFIMKRTDAYLGKVSRLNNNSLPKNFLAACISGSWKNGAHKLTCNNNFAETINKIVPLDKTLSSKNVPLGEWFPLAKEENNWQALIDNYFEMCRKNDPHEESDSDSDDEAEWLYWYWHTSALYPQLVSTSLPTPLSLPNHPCTTTIHTPQNLRYK